MMKSALPCVDYRGGKRFYRKVDLMFFPSTRKFRAEIDAADPVCRGNGIRLVPV
jgi:hypothetical protein